MIRLIVEIEELKDERKATRIGFKTEEDRPTEAEQFWQSRLYPVMKEALNMRGLLGERALVGERKTTG